MTWELYDQMCIRDSLFCKDNHIFLKSIATFHRFSSNQKPQLLPSA